MLNRLPLPYLQVYDYRERCNVYDSCHRHSNCDRTLGTMGIGQPQPGSSMVNIDISYLSSLVKQYAPHTLQ